MTTNLKKLLQKLRQEEINYVILSDTNSHSSLYGSETTNKRGEIIENELIAPNNLLVLNEGNEPTFYSRRWGTATHTDVILAGPETSQFFSGFKVRDACCPSDHASLEIRLHLGTTPATEEMFDFENMTREQKKEFKEAMEIKSGPEIGCDEKVVCNDKLTGACTARVYC